MSGGLAFSVEKGAHAGANAKSPSGRFSIGSGLENDIVLLADQLGPNHARISLIDAWRKRVRIEAEDRAVQLGDGRRIEAGHYADIALPARLRLGTAECQIDTARDTGGLKRFVVPAALVLGAMIILPMLAGAIGLTGPKSSLPSPAIVVANSLAGSDGANVAVWQGRLAERLGAAGLSGQVSIERGPSGNLIAVGVIDEAVTEKWREIVRWYDAQGNGPLLVNNVTRSGTNTELPAFRAVWLDNRPQAVLQNGQTAGIGDTVTGGWRIEAIDATGVTLTRDGRAAKLAF